MKKLWGAIGFFILGCFFLTWAMQTAWLASFSSQGLEIARFRVYMEFATGVVLVLISGWLVFKWKRGK